MWPVFPHQNSLYVIKLRIPIFYVLFSLLDVLFGNHSTILSSPNTDSWYWDCWNVYIILSYQKTEFNIRRPMPAVCNSFSSSVS